VKYIRAFLALLIPTILLFLIFKYFLVYKVGWHDGLNLDWYAVYYPAAHFANPYVVPGYFNPPWLAWLLRPLTHLSPVDAHILWIVIIILLTVRCVYALGGRWLAVLLTIASPGFVLAIINGQPDILVLLGLLTGSWLLILIKPQVAAMAIIYQAIRYRRVDWLAVTAVPLVFIILPPPALNTLTWEVGVTPWPWGIPFGLALFALALFRRDKYMAAMSTFFLVPYLSGSSAMVYSAILASRYGRLFALISSVIIWILYHNWLW
jgi:hypothetical protein